MGNEFEISAFWSEGDPDRLDHDVLFYHQIPGISVRSTDRETGRRVLLPSFDVEQILQCLGVAVISSGTLARIVLAWLQSHRSRIVISAEGSTTRIEYEGPNLREDLGEIEKRIDWPHRVLRPPNGRLQGSRQQG
jgi:hypothetical protein